MPTRTLLMILGSVSFSVAGQLLLKSGAERLAGARPLEFFVAAFRNAYVLAGLTAWIASTLCWLLVLREAPLSRAYGLTSLTYVLIVLTSVLFFGEQLRPVHVLGTLLIVVGITCLLSGK